MPLHLLYGRRVRRMLTLGCLAMAAQVGVAADTGVDPTVVPGDDFFAYANGEWLKTAQIPPDRSSWGVFAQLAESTDRRVADLLQNPGAADPAERKAADYYATFMDATAVEARGLAPVQPELAQIAALADRHSLAQWLGGTLRADVDVLNATSLATPNIFGIWIAQDLDQPTRYLPFLIQGGLQLPDREYYLGDSPHMQEIRARYLAHIAAVLTLAGSRDAAAEAQRVFDLEKRIAGVHVDRAASEDVKRGDNHWTRAELAQRAPGLDWDALLTAAGLTGREFVIWQPQAVTGIAALVGSEPLDTWRLYLRFHLLERAAAYLPQANVEESFKFYGAALRGTVTLRERWKRGVTATNVALGEAVGKLYVQHDFPADAKQRIQGLVRQLLAAYIVRIDRLDWMAPATRAEAKAKVAALRIGIGFPDTWRDYSDLEVVPGDAYGNFERAERCTLRYEEHKLGLPVNRSEWVVLPQVVNANNLPAMNALNFPAAILQPPFYDARRSDAANFGAIGAVIGHEISHSFDDQGALFDSHGRLHDWWTPRDFEHFRAAGAQLVKQFDAYTPLPDLHVNGAQTLSENIADVAGLADAYDAWRHAAPGRAAPGRAAPGRAATDLQAEREFFLSFAQSWRAKLRDAALREGVITDGHAPDEYRADSVRNLDAWYRAFDVQPGQHLYLAPPDRVTVW